MDTEPTRDAQAGFFNSITHKNLVRLLGVVVVCALIISGVWFYQTQSGKHAGPVPFSLYENGAYRWYELSQKSVSPAFIPEGAKAGSAVFPNGASISVTEEGLVWMSAEQKTKIVLVERKGLAPDTSAVSLDGSTAVLYNEVTSAFDVFSVTYEGAYVSYAGSIPMPALPSYLVAVGAVTPSTIVVRTGDPESFLLYEVGTASVRESGTASLQVPASK